MHFSRVVLGSAAASLAAAAPFSFPLANGFPNLNTTEMAEVYKLAGGTLPNGALPTALSDSGTQTLQLIAANEIFEVAYFTELLANVTNDVPGYALGADKDYVVKTLTAVMAVSCPQMTWKPSLTRNSKNKFTPSEPTESSPAQTAPQSNPANTPSQSPPLTTQYSSPKPSPMSFLASSPSPKPDSQPTVAKNLV